MSLLERDNSFSVHDYKIQQLAMEMYKVAYGLVSKATSVLSHKYSMQTWSQSEFLVPQINRVFFGQNSIRYILWNSMPLTLKNGILFPNLRFLLKIGNHQLPL